MQKFDAIIIGSGQGGVPLAKKLANAGWKTALIEKRYIGGTCVNDGCTPTKAMIASARMAYMASRSSDWGIHIPDFTVDIKKVVSRKNGIVQSFREGSEKGLEQTPHLTTFFGEASFSGKQELKVLLNDGGEIKLTGEKIFINTGTQPFIPEISGLKDVNYHTSTTLLDVEKIPHHLIIIGGGYIGLEYGQMFRRFGSQVTIVESFPRFLPREDEDIAGAIKEILEEEGIKIYTNASVDRVTQDKNLHIQLVLKPGCEIKDLRGTGLLVAAGRQPQTTALQLQHPGVQTNEKGYIRVNEYLETNIPGIYALGDVKGGPAFTHISYNDYIILYKNLLENNRLSISGRPVPYCMFTDPQLGRIGLTEQEARKEGIDIKVAVLPMNRVARGIETGQTRGMMKAIVAASSGKILGAAILGEEGGEVMSVLQMAMMGGITYDVIRENIFAHPLYTESLNNLFMALED